MDLLFCGYKDNPKQQAIMLIRFHLLLLAFAVMFVPVANADSPHWSLVVHQELKSPSLKNFAKRNHILFKHFIDSSLRQKGRKDFIKVTKRVKNNIYWKGDKRRSVYLDAFRRSYPVIKGYRQQNIPEIVFLIPYLESLWNAESGKPSAEYGYWQLIGPTVEEIQALETSPESIKHIHPNKVRSSPDLSTKVALIHLRRYYFYFAKVANYSDTEAWLFSMLSYNWGAGNVKRLIAEMDKKQLDTSFSGFYHYLYQKQQKNKNDVSMRAALEYLPNLWSIAKLIRERSG